MSQNTKDTLRQAFDQIAVAPELDNTIRRSVARASSLRRRQAVVKKSLLSIAAAFLIFTTSVNVLPALGNTMEGIPVLGRLVSALRLDRLEVGGQVTDGMHVGPLTFSRDTVTINFTENNSPAAKAPWYKVTQHSHPHSLIIEAHGVRGLHPNAISPNFAGNAYIRYMYRSVILDDSAQRFVIVFNQPVAIEVRELTAPAALQLVLSAAAPVNEDAVYAVRTYSQASRGSAGELEESIRAALEWQGEGVRILRDSQGGYMAEADFFSTEIAAQEFVAKLRAAGLADLPLTIERRGPNDIPQHLLP